MYKALNLIYVMKKKKKYNSQKTLESIRRENELKEYGKLVSLRPSIEHKSKKLYNRKLKHKENYEIE